jgi:putative tryptophan/tyrosine transport system substrate-binding protein
MKRREFITLLGGAAVAAWPLAAHAQQAGSIPRIGVLWPGDAPPVSPRMESFRQGLRASGFIDGQNIAIELRYAHRGPQQLPELAAELVGLKVAAELVGLKVDVIFASGDLAPKVAQSS